MDYYRLLEVPRTAHQDEIRKAFRRKAKLYHPDVNDDPYARSQFVKINEAYRILNDEEKRKLYDQKLNGVFPPRAVNQRPTQTRYRAPGDKYAHYRTPQSAKSQYSRLDMFFLFLIVLPLLISIYRWWIDKMEPIFPYRELIIGIISLCILVIIGLIRRRKLRE